MRIKKKLASILNTRYTRAIKQRSVFIMWFIIALIAVIFALMFFLPSLGSGKRKKSDNQEQRIEEIRNHIKQDMNGPKY